MALPTGHEFEPALGVGDGQGSWVCCSPWGYKELDTTEQLNWTELNSSLGSHYILHFWLFSSLFGFPFMESFMISLISAHSLNVHVLQIPLLISHTLLIQSHHKYINRWILYQLSHKGSPNKCIFQVKSLLNPKSQYPTSSWISPVGHSSRTSIPAFQHWILNFLLTLTSHPSKLASPLCSFSGNKTTIHLVD